MHSLLVLLAVIASASAIGLGIGRRQAAGVRGMLTCNGRPAANVKVKLYDEDDFGVDDKLQEGRTDAQGRYQLAGSTTEVTSIDPKLNIYHDCNDNLPCQRKFTIKIPDSYITQGQVPSRYYEAGTIELSGRFSGESRDCVN